MVENTPPSIPYGRLRQTEVYTSGMLADQPPEYPVSYDKLKEKAEQALTPEAYAYIAGGAGSEKTKRENSLAIDEWKIIPRILRDVSERDLSIKLFVMSYRCRFCWPRLERRVSSTKMATSHLLVRPLQREFHSSSRRRPHIPSRISRRRWAKLRTGSSCTGVLTVM